MPSATYPIIPDRMRALFALVRRRLLGPREVSCALFLSTVCLLHLCRLESQVQSIRSDVMLNTIMSLRVVQICF